MAGPRQLVDPPPFTSSPYGLLDVARSIGATTPHWQNGVTWQSHCLEVGLGALTYDECIAVTGVGAVPEPSIKTDNVDSINRGATPFTPFTRFDCSPVGLDDARRVAVDALAQSESWQVERAFWTGLVDGKILAFPHLAANAEVTDSQGIILQTAATDVAVGAHDVAEGLGLLEAALADCYNGVGVVHVPVKALPTLVAANLVDRVDSHLETTRGNLVAVGAGYPGTSPAGATPAVNQSWLYATGAVFVYRGDIKFNTLRDSIDRADNTVEMIAERTYVLGWDCCHVAVLIDLGVPLS